jgi:hypothetical protein
MLYCVRVHEHPYVYRVEADTPSAAEAQVIAANWAGSYEDIAHVDVGRRCEQCGVDNMPGEPACDECGSPL